MQIVRTQPFASLPVVQEPLRERSASDNAALPIQSQGQQERRAAMAIEDIQSAERMLNRRRTQDPYAALAQDGRQQRAVAAYQALQQDDERSYVSEVLGIDVYA
jgi:hypothetical protein